jgi:transposase
LRILLCARQELTTTSTAQTNRLKALLRDGDDTDRRLARGELTLTTLAELIKRRLPRDASRQQTIRHAEIHRLAVAIRDARQILKTNRAELAAIVHDLVPGLTQRPGIGPVSATQAIVSFSHPGRCRNDAAFAKLAGTSPLEASSGKTSRRRLM